MISFAKISTRDAYDALTPVQDRLYMIEQTGELLFNGKPYNGDDGTRDWLCFTNTYEGENTVKIVLVNNPSTASLEYSKDGINWTVVEWSNGESQTVTLDQGEKVYFRGDNPDFNFGQWNSSLGADAYHKFVLGEPSVCSGSILSLFSKDCKYGKAIRVNRLFEGCAIVTAPKLSAKVQAYGYKQLFKDCVSLAVAPELPATELAQSCYESTFEGCTSLHVAPALPAPVMVASCYKAMFRNATSLAVAPDLPATTMADNAYQEMFSGCSSLVTAPTRLPSMTMAASCYNGMFKDCVNLRKPPVLPATTMASSCYANMFKNTGLTEVPNLPAATLAYSCYSGMFGDCTRLESIPLDLLPSTTLEAYCYQWMFAGCTALKCGCRLPAYTLVEKCYSHMYDGCTSLTDTELMRAQTLATGAFYQTFKGCSKLCRLRIPNMTAFDENATPQWLQGLSNKGRAFVCSSQLDTSTRNESRIPEGWIPTQSAYAADALIPRWTVSAGNFTFCPSNSEQDVLNIQTDTTINAVQLPSGYVGSAQAYVLWRSDSEATLTAGTGITFIDTPHKGYMSHVLVTWDGTHDAQLRVMWETAL